MPDSDRAAHWGQVHIRGDRNPPLPQPGAPRDMRMPCDRGWFATLVGRWFG